MNSKIRYSGFRYLVLLLLALLPFNHENLQAQKKVAAASQRALPAAERVVGNYLKAIGGKKRVASIRDATYDWVIELNGQAIGTARTQVKAPTSVRFVMTFENGQIISAASSSSTWVRGLDGELSTLTGPQAAAAKLQAALDASHVVDYKKLNVLARVVLVGDLASQPSYIVEFSTRGGARLRYWFSISTKLLVKIDDEARKTTTRFSDHHIEGDLIEPHRIDIAVGGTGGLTLLLQHVSYNTNLPTELCDPPRGNEALDVQALLREVGRNQDVVEKRFAE